MAKTLRIKAIDNKDYTIHQTEVGIPTSDVAEMSDYSSLNDTDTIFFDKSGADSNSGTKASPKLTIQGACTQALSDGKQYVANNDTERQVYSEKVNIWGRTVVALNHISPIIRPGKLSYYNDHGMLFYNMYHDGEYLYATSRMDVYRMLDSKSGFSFVSSDNVSCITSGTVGGTNHLYFAVLSSTDIIVDNSTTITRPSSDEVNYMFVFKDELYISTDNNTYKYDGSSWTTMGVLYPQYYLDVLYYVSGTDIKMVSGGDTSTYEYQTTIKRTVRADENGIYFTDSTDTLMRYNFVLDDVNSIEQGDVLQYNQVAGIWYKIVLESGDKNLYMYFDNDWSFVAEAEMVIEYELTNDYNYNNSNFNNNYILFLALGSHGMGVMFDYTIMSKDSDWECQGTGTIEGYTIDANYNSSGITNVSNQYCNMINGNIGYNSNKSSTTYSYNSLYDNCNISSIMNQVSGSSTMFEKNLIKKSNVGILLGTGPGTEIIKNITIVDCQLGMDWNDSSSRLVCYNMIMSNNQNNLRGGAKDSHIINSSLEYDQLSYDQTELEFTDCHSVSPAWDDEYRLLNKGNGALITSPFFAGEKWDGYNNLCLGAYADDTMTVASITNDFNIELKSKPSSTLINSIAQHYKKSFSMTGEMYQSYAENSEMVTLQWADNSASTSWNEQYYLLKNVIENYDTLKLGRTDGTGGWDSYLTLTDITNTANDNEYTATSPIELLKNEYVNYYILIDGNYYRIKSHTVGTSITLILNCDEVFTSEKGNIDYRLMRIDKSNQFNVNVNSQLGIKTGYSLVMYVIKSGGEDIE